MDYQKEQKRRYQTFHPDQLQSQKAKRRPANVASSRGKTDDWRSDQVWTFITAYLEDMFIPGEG